MAGFMSTAKKHRERAEELRGLALVVTNAEQKIILRSIAANYDQLALSIERAASFQNAEASALSLVSASAPRESAVLRRLFRVTRYLPAWLQRSLLMSNATFFSSRSRKRIM
jgi:hypothetical protein